MYPGGQKVVSFSFYEFMWSLPFLPWFQSVFFSRHVIIIMRDTQSIISSEFYRNGEEVMPELDVANITTKGRTKDRQRETNIDEKKSLGAKQEEETPRRFRQRWMSQLHVTPHRSLPLESFVFFSRKWPGEKREAKKERLKQTVTKWGRLILPLLRGEREKEPGGMKDMKERLTE